MRWLAAAWLSGLVFLTVALGDLIPERGLDQVHYTFIPCGPVLFLTTGLVALCLLVIAFRLVGRAGHARSAACGEAASRGLWLQPLAATGVVMAGLTPAAPAIGERASVLGYFFYDLRFWWLAL